MTNSIDRLAARLMRLERSLHAATTTPQLEYSAIMDGAIASYDVDDNLTQILGKQYDGTWATTTVTGPVPPTPTAPIVTPGPDSATVKWDGLFADDPTTVAPMDFSRVEVHLSSDPNADFATADGLRDSIETPRGGEIVVSPLIAGTTYYAALVTRTTSGASSAVSAIVTVVPEGVVSDADIQAIQDEVDAANAAATDAQTAANSASLDAASALQKATDAQSAADAASTAAAQAQSDADAANQQALDAANLAADKGTVYAQPTAPAGDPNGLWIDTDDGNKPYTWDGTQWVASQDASIQAAADAAAAADTKATQASTDAANAQSAASQASTDAANALSAATQASSDASNALEVAGSKAKVYYASAAPSGGTYAVDDLWFDTTSSAYTPHRWDGSAWAAVPFGTNALADGIITAAKIVTGTITGDKIKAGEIDSDLLAAGAIIAGKIAADAVDANAIAANAVTAAKIAAGQIEAGHLAAGAVTTAALDALAVTTDKLAANAVTADNIAAGAITSDKIDAQAVWAGTITADHIQDGDLSAEVAVVGSLTAYGANGELVQLSGDGFIVKGAPQPDGSQPTFVNFPTQGDKPDIFTGVLDATTLTTENGATLQGITQVAPKGQLLLGNQIQPPANSPSVDVGWDSVNADQIENSREWHGLAYNASDGTWWSMWYRSNDDTSGLTQWDADGVVLRDMVTGASRGRARGVIWQPINGGRFFTLRNAQGEAGWVDRLEVWDNTFTTQYATYDFRINYGIFWGAIGWDYTNNRLIYSYYNDTEPSPFSNGLPQSPIVFEHWNINADSTVGTKAKTRSTLGSANYAEGIASVDYGTFDFGDGVSRYVTHLRSEHTQSPVAIRSKFLVFPDTAGAAHDDGWSWNNAGGYDVCGTHWDGSNFRSLGAKGTRWKYEGGLSYYHGDSTTPDWHIGYTWRDGVSPFHETTLSPTVLVSPAKRTRLSVTIGTVPTGDADYPDRARIYIAMLGHGAAAFPLTYDLWAEPLAGTTSWTMDPKGAAIDSTTGAPGSNTFPSTTSPGLLTNPPGTIKLSGDGSGAIGSLSWDKQGSLLTDFNKPYVSEYRINNLSVGTGGSAVIVNFGTTEAWVNVAAGGIVGNGDGTYTINMPGKYIVMAQLSWDSNSSGRREVSIWLNGTSEIAYTAGGAGAQNQSTNVIKAFALKAGDVIDVRAWQNSGAALNVVGGLNRTSIQIAMIAGN